MPLHLLLLGKVRGELSSIVILHEKQWFSNVCLSLIILYTSYPAKHQCRKFNRHSSNSFPFKISIVYWFNDISRAQNYNLKSFLPHKLTSKMPGVPRRYQTKLSLLSRSLCCWMKRVFYCTQNIKHERSNDCKELSDKTGILSVIPPRVFVC